MRPLPAQTTPRLYLFLLALRSRDAKRLYDLLESAVADYGKGIQVDFTILPYESPSLNGVVQIIESLGTDVQPVLVAKDTENLHKIVAELPGRVLIYIGTRSNRPPYEAPGCTNIKTFPVRTYADFAAEILQDFSALSASSADQILFNFSPAFDRLKDASTPGIGALNIRGRKEPSLISGLPETSLIFGLSEIGLTIDELMQIVLLEDDPDAAALLGSWFDSRRQVALTIAGGCLAGAIAAFIGDATVIGAAHGIFSGSPETGAVIGLTTLTGASIVAGTYYLNKVRRIANKSLRVQHLLNRRRWQ